jgi:hypothetical protein
LMDVVVSLSLHVLGISLVGILISLVLGV